jgi:hypothetical protein
MTKRGVLVVGPLRPDAHLRAEPALPAQPGRRQVSGLQAIQFAQEGKWDALLSYCADDVRILCDLYRRRFLNNPRFHRVIDLRAIAHASTYKQDNPRATQEQETQTEPCAELLELRQRLAVYTEFCVCLDD